MGWYTGIPWAGTGVVFAVLVSGCLEPSTISCGDLICPGGLVCSAPHGLCVNPTQRSACEDLPDGTACSYAGVPAGLCDRGVCFATGCGNGMLDEGEVCDDGNLQPGDGCSADCLSNEACGNGILDRRTEQCDCGVPGALGDDCTEPNSLEPGACRPDCQIPRCGDGIVDPNEHCEPGSLDQTCESLGLYGGTLQCSPACLYDVSSCGRCGDGIINGPELCDGTAPPGGCLDYGFDVGRLECSAACTPDIGSCRKIGWPSVPVPATSRLNDAWGSGANDIFAVGDGGTILHFDGISWSPMDSGTSADLLGVWGTGPGDVYAAGDMGVLLHWDGGSWEPLDSTTTDDLSDVWVGGGEIFALAIQGRVHHRDASGWSTETLPIPNPTYGIWGSGPDDVWVAGDGVARYDGATWKEETTGPDLAHSVWGRGPDDVFVGRIEGQIHHYDGNGWSVVLDLGAEAGGTFLSIWGTGPDHVFAAGGTSTIVHFDGDTWTPMRVSSTQFIRGLWGGGPDDVWAVGDSGIVRRFTGWAWTADAYGELGAQMLSIWSTGRRAAAVGDIACIFDGARWQPEGECEPVGGITLQDVAGSSADHIVAVGANLTAVRWDGTSWSSITGIDPSGPDAHLKSVWVTSESSMFLGTLSGRVYEWNGFEWLRHEVGPESSLVRDLWSSAPGEAWAIVADTPHRLAAGVWTAHPAPDFIEALWGPTPSDIRAVASSGVYSWNGTNWLLEPAPGGNLRDIDGSGPDDVFAVGQSGTILYDDGMGWLPVRSPTAMPLRKVSVSPDAVFFAGYGASTGEGDVFGLLRVTP